MRALMPLMSQMTPEAAAVRTLMPCCRVRTPTNAAAGKLYRECIKEQLDQYSVPAQSVSGLIHYGFHTREVLLLQHLFKVGLVHLLACRHGVHDRHQIGEALAALVGQDSRYGYLVHLGFQSMQLHESCGGMLVCDPVKRILDLAAIFRLY